MTVSRRHLGQAGEDAAARWYEARGYRIEARNWRCRDGEIDLILSLDGQLIFCEVKTRSSDRFGSGADAVTPVKQARLRRLASLYLKERDRPYAPNVRFDVASLAGLKVTIIEDAF